MSRPVRRAFVPLFNRLRQRQVRPVSWARWLPPHTRWPES